MYEDLYLRDLLTHIAFDGRRALVKQSESGQQAVLTSMKFLMQDVRSVTAGWSWKS
jgi:hypothetical protein